MTDEQKPLPVAPRYRARLVDPGDLKAERPVQVYGNDWREIEAWAKARLDQAQSPDATVNAFETHESWVKLFAKEPKKA